MPPVNVVRQGHLGDGINMFWPRRRYCSGFPIVHISDRKVTDWRIISAVDGTNVFTVFGTCFAVRSALGAIAPTMTPNRQAELNSEKVSSGVRTYNGTFGRQRRG
jgi:hypothetical protein